MGLARCRRRARLGRLGGVPRGDRLGITVALALTAAAAAFAAFSTAGVRDDAAPATTVKVGVREWAFDLSQESAPVGTVTFAITNTGQSEPHDFAVNGRTSAVLMPGESTTLTVDFSQPGVYPYVDTRADTDHEMYGSFTVTGPAVDDRGDHDRRADDDDRGADRHPVEPAAEARRRRAAARQCVALRLPERRPVAAAALHRPHGRRPRRRLRSRATACGEGHPERAGRARRARRAEAPTAVRRGYGRRASS